MLKSFSPVMILAAMALALTTPACALDDVGDPEVDFFEESETTSELSNGWHTICWPSAGIYEWRYIGNGVSTWTHITTWHSGHTVYQYEQRWLGWAGYHYSRITSGRAGGELWVRTAALC